MPMKDEKVVEAVIDEEKPYFFPRMVAYIIDIIIVALISTCLVSLMPNNDNYLKYVKEYDTVQSDFLNQKIDMNEYLNKSVDVVYDIDYNNVPAMIIQVVVVIGYFVIYQFYNKGQTIGKKLMKLKVVSTNGNGLTLNQITYRALLVNSVLINILILGCLLFIGRGLYYYSSLGLQGLELIIIITVLMMVLIRKDGRGLHDLVASTKVLSVK